MCEGFLETLARSRRGNLRTLLSNGACREAGHQAPLAESLHNSAGAPPNLDANREERFDKESYFYVKGKLIRVEGPATINAVAQK